RVVCVFDDDTLGRWVLVLVGATIVGSMATVWQGRIERGGSVKAWDYAPGQVTLAQGEEMGRFLLGSMVVMLFEKSGLQFNPSWRPGG
ncbi:phosphatidylserine decarboxylase, partial [Acinetobacter baumannii]